MKRSEEIRTMIARQLAGPGGRQPRAHEIQDGLAGVDTLIRSILEVSHDMRQITDRLAAAYLMVAEETLRSLREEAGGVSPGDHRVSRGKGRVMFLSC